MNKELKDKIIQLIDTRIQSALQSFLTGHTPPGIINDMFELRGHVSKMTTPTTRKKAPVKRNTQ